MNCDSVLFAMSGIFAAKKLAVGKLAAQNFRHNLVQTAFAYICVYHASSEPLFRLGLGLGLGLVSCLKALIQK